MGIVLVSLYKETLSCYYRCVEKDTKYISVRNEVKNREVYADLSLHRIAKIPILTV